MTDTGGDPIDAGPDAPPDALVCGVAPNLDCGGTCTNTNTDNNNCGACGTVCGSGESCTMGICCAAGESNCNGVCVNLNTDNDHCGTCTEVCDTGGGETCQNGTCCGGGNTACGNQCFDLQTDPMHCGTCNTACPQGNICSDGICCAADQLNCGGACVDPDTNNNNCGGCSPANGGTGAVCDTGAGSTCDDGICCTAPTENCNGTCLNTDTDLNNCGACGVICDGTCNAGKCCPAGSISCDGTTCIDPNDNQANCGGCTNTGAGEACVSGELCDSGECCGPGTENCNGTCVDVLDDNANCGACGAACALGEVCSGGTCSGSCAGNETNCSGDCVDTVSDHDNCGTCGRACGPTEVCSNSACTTTCDSLTNCGGSCVDLSTDPTHCGNCQTDCPANNTCSGGACCPVGQVNTGGGLCCPAGWLNCNGVCADPTADTTCGACNLNCDATGKDCIDGTPSICCLPTEERCGNTCVDKLNDEANCGACGATCAGTCDNGVCCTGTEENCGGTCQDTQTDVANCGVCGNDCGADESCSGGLCCPSGQTNVDGICCTIGFLNCNGTCKNPDVDETACGGCTIQCGQGQTCLDGGCTANCDAPRDLVCGFCTDRATDPDACGDGCIDCPTGSTCSGGSCQACPAGAPTTCGAVSGQGGTCVNIGINGGNCGGCGTMCVGADSCDPSTIVIAAAPTGAVTANVSGTFTTTITTTLAHGFIVGQLVIVSGVGVAGYNGTFTITAVPSATTFRYVVPSSLANSGGGTVATGECCAPGFDSCPGATGTADDNPMCVNKLDDVNNCGGCGNVCAAGSLCNAGVCECPFGQDQCTGGCKTTSVDPDNCGACNVACASTEACVSGGCVATCPAPLSKCAVTGGFECTNNQSDSDNCGTCGTVCPGGTGCSGGQCVTQTNNAPPPAKCVGGGPPIVVDDGTGEECTGNIGAVSFRFGMCSLASLATADSNTAAIAGIDISQILTTDAFDSTVGPYSPTAPIYGGGIGANATVNNIKATTVGGDFWVYGTQGLSHKGDVLVKSRLFVRKVMTYQTAVVQGLGLLPGSTDQANVGQGSNTNLTAGTGQTSFTVAGTLRTNTPCNVMPGTTVATTELCGLAAPAFAMAPPCDTTNDRVKVREIVANAKLNNDNALIGLSTQALNDSSTITRLDLDCGRYYLDTLNIGKTTTIYVHGRTALFIGGSVRVSQKLVFDLDPTATLDIFVAGVVNVSNEVTLGSPAYPRLSRLYVGSATCLGSGACSSDATCCSGVCSAGVCTAGGGNLSQAMSLSNGGYFNGLLYTAYGEFNHQGPMEMYGSIFTNTFSASGDTIIHYDKGAVTTGDECPPPDQNEVCESCRDCNNQACVNNTCGACTSNDQCCAPLVCDNGTCRL